MGKRWSMPKLPKNPTREDRLRAFQAFCDVHDPKGSARARVRRKKERSNG